jgi:ATP-binding cassette, subfamily B, bacterial
MKTVCRVFAYLKRYPWLATGTLTCAILGTAMVIIFPTVTKWIINDVVRANHPERLLPLILLAALAFLVQQSRYGRFDDARDRRCEFGRARAD